MGITDSGQIAVGDHADFGPYRSYLMLPVPQSADSMRAWQNRANSADLDGDGQVTTAPGAIGQYLRQNPATTPRR
jgi:hypothetical protein